MATSLVKGAIIYSNKRTADESGIGPDSEVEVKRLKLGGASFTNDSEYLAVNGNAKINGDLEVTGSSTLTFSNVVTDSIQNKTGGTSISLKDSSGTEVGQLAESGHLLSRGIVFIPRTGAEITADGHEEEGLIVFDADRHMMRHYYQHEVGGGADVPFYCYEPKVIFQTTGINEFNTTSALLDHATLAKGRGRLEIDANQFKVGSILNIKMRGWGNGNVTNTTQTFYVKLGSATWSCAAEFEPTTGDFTMDFCIICKSVGVTGNFRGTGTVFSGGDHNNSDPVQSFADGEVDKVLDTTADLNILVQTQFAVSHALNKIDVYSLEIVRHS